MTSLENIKLDDETTVTIDSLQKELKNFLGFEPTLEQVIIFSVSKLNKVLQDHSTSIGRLKPNPIGNNYNTGFNNRTKSKDEINKEINGGKSQVYSGGYPTHTDSNPNKNVNNINSFASFQRDGRQHMFSDNLSDGLNVSVEKTQ